MIDPRELRKCIDAAESIREHMSPEHRGNVYYTLFPASPYNGKQQVAPGLWADVVIYGLIAKIRIDEAERWLLEQAVFGLRK